MRYDCKIEQEYIGHTFLYKADRNMAIRNVYYLIRSIDCLIKACSRNMTEYKHTYSIIQNYFVEYEEKVMIYRFCIIIMFLSQPLGSLKCEASLNQRPVTILWPAELPSSASLRK